MLLQSLYNRALNCSCSFKDLAKQWLEWCFSPMKYSVILRKLEMTSINCITSNIWTWQNNRELSKTSFLFNYFSLFGSISWCCLCAVYWNSWNSQAVLETVARVKPKKNETKDEKYVSCLHPPNWTACCVLLL